MKCPYCSHLESKVTDSRVGADGCSIRRRRECLECKSRFTTFETVDLTIQVQKRDGNFEDFAIEKLIKGLSHACRHTRVSNEMVQQVASEIASELLETGERVVTTTELGERVMRKLQRLDTVAYIRFACVYRRFKDMEELIDAIHTLGSEEAGLKK